MFKFEINKYKKKIKVIKKSNTLFVIGPLGTININLKAYIHNLNDTTRIFIKNTSLRFFFNKIKFSFKSITSGYFKELILNGIGYKCFKINDKIALDLGYSCLILYKPTEQIKFKNLKNKILLFSTNKEYLNNVIILLKNYSIPNNYKGTGLLFKNEHIKLKKKAKI